MSTSPGRKGPGIVSIIKTNDCVAAGMFDQLSDGDTPLPSQVNSGGSSPPSLKSGLVKIRFLVAGVTASGVLTTFRNKIVLSNFKSDDHTSAAPGAQVKSKYPSFTPTVSLENSVAFFHVESLKVAEAQVEGIATFENLQSTLGVLEETHWI